MKWFKRISLSVIVTYLVALGLDIFISKSLLKTSLFEGELEVMNDIYNDNISEDLLIYGSSRSCVHINPKILDKKLNIDSYNLGFNGQKVRLVKFRNDILLENNIIPKNVIINLDINFFGNYGMRNPAQFLPILLYDYNKYNFFKNDIKLYLLDIYMPLIRYRKLKEYNISLLKELNKIYFGSDYRKKIRYKGFEGKNYKWSESSKKNLNFKINPLRKKELIDMIEGLIQLDVNVILINSPEYIERIAAQENRGEIISLYKQLAFKYDIPFIDYTNDTINHNKEYFYNEEHLNAKGADIFTKKLAEDIKPYIKR